VLVHEGSLHRRPRFVWQEVRRSTALMAARSRRRGYFPLPRTAADICVRTVRKGPAIRFQVIAADTVPVGPSTASVYRPPPGNWQSRWSTGDYLLRGPCGRCGRSRPAIFWRTGDTTPFWLAARLDGELAALKARLWWKRLAG
jgi:hypothetical protein